MIREEFNSMIEIDGKVETDLDGNGAILKLKVEDVHLDWWIYNRINFSNKIKITIKIEPSEED